MTESDQRNRIAGDPLQQRDRIAGDLSQQRDRIAGDLSQQRDRIVNEARRWIGTPYHNCADVLGSGVDCGMLIVRVFADTGLCPPFDPRPYAPDWHLHRGEERYLGFVFDHCAEVAEPAPGDVVVFRYGRCYSHGGIVTKADPLTIVHAFWPAGIVLEEEVAHNAQLADPARARRFFSYWATGVIPAQAGIQGPKAQRPERLPLDPRLREDDRSDELERS